MTSRLTKLGMALLVAGSLGVVGCESEDPVFGRVEKRDIVIADFEDFELPGQARLVYSASVSADMVHPEFTVRWTNTTPDVVVDLYIVRAEAYDPAVPPPSLTDVFWKSARSGGQFGEPMTNITVHPTPGEWVIVFFNAADAGRRTLFADLSADARLTYFANASSD